MSKFSRQGFHIVEAAEENERWPNVFARSLGIHRILLSEEERKNFLVCRLRVDETSK